MCHLYVMSDRGAETRNGHSWQGQEVIGRMIRAGAGVVGGVKVGADDSCHADRRWCGCLEPAIQPVHV